MPFYSRPTLIPLTAAILLIAGCATSTPDRGVAIGDEEASRENTIGDENNASGEAGLDVDAPLPDGVISLADSETVELEGLDVKVLHKANYNPLDADNGKSFKALRTAEVYASELARHSIESAKPVDFETSQVLVSSVGEKPTGGYAVSVVNVSEFDDDVIVTVVQTIPGPGCITIQGVTHPFEFVIIPTRKPIEIYERQKVDPC